MRDLYRRTSAGETSLPAAKVELAILNQAAKEYTDIDPFDEMMKNIRGRRSYG